MRSTSRSRSGTSRHHSFRFDRITAVPDFSRFGNWYALRSFFAPKRAEIDAVLSQPEAEPDKAA